MSILDDCPGEGYKLCKTKLHWYLPGKGCPECKRLNRLTYYQNNKKALIERAKAWNKANKDKYNENYKRWQKRNLKTKLEANRNWYNKNLKTARESHKRKYDKWKINNRDKLNAKRSRRRAREMNAYVKWASKEKIEQVYKAAATKTKITGIKHHVDHIFPLKSDWLCGLHVEQNLQVLPFNENIAKGNKIWPGQLDCQKGSVYDIFPIELTNLLNEET